MFLLYSKSYDLGPILSSGVALQLLLAPKALRRERGGGAYPPPSGPSKVKGGPEPFVHDELGQLLSAQDADPEVFLVPVLLGHLVGSSLTSPVVTTSPTWATPSRKAWAS